LSGEIIEVGASVSTELYEPPRSHYNEVWPNSFSVLRVG